MKSAILFVLAAVFAIGVGQDHHGARTFGTSLNVGSSHDAHHHHQHQLPAPAVPSPAAVVPSEIVKTQTVPVLIGQIVNFPVVETVPQQTAVGSISGASGVVSSLVHTQQQVVGNITAGFGSVVTSVVNPVVALLQNASLWLNRTAQANIPSPHHDHAAAAVHHHGSHGAHGHSSGGVGNHGIAATHDHIGHVVNTAHAHHGSGQVSPVASIPVFIINGQKGQQVPTVGAPVLINGQQGQQVPTVGAPVPALGSQLVSFGVQAPVAALGSFRSSAADPILGTAAPVTTSGATVPTTVVAPVILEGTRSGNVTFAAPVDAAATTVEPTFVPLATTTVLPTTFLPPRSKDVQAPTAAPMLRPVLGSPPKNVTV